LLPADAVIVNALRLPSMMLVTPPVTTWAATQGEGAFLDALETVASAGRLGTGGLICLRRPDLDADALLELAAGAACRIDGSGVRLLLHGAPETLAPLLREPPPNLRARLGDAIAGLHVPARCLAGSAGVAARPVPGEMWFGVSCHSAEELVAAQAAGADYAFLGNVRPTDSHPDRPGLGWEQFAAQVAALPMPVYGIGGLGPDDLDDAWAAGAQGIAAIRGLWG
jgi:8-oxo-dGTP diphosphatase